MVNREKASGVFGTLQALIVFIVMFVLLSIFVDNFFTVTNITNLMKQNATNLIIGAGMTVVILTGEFDISVGSIMGLAAFTGVTVMNGYGIPLGILSAAAIGLLFGLINGVLTTKGKIPSFIATLGTQMVARGLCLVMSGGFPEAMEDRTLGALSQGDFLGIPNLFWIVIIVYVIVYILLKKTAFGQHVYAVGSNRNAAVLSGINADFVKIRAFLLIGFLAGFCGILSSARVFSASPETGTGVEFEVIAGVVIGGTSVSGGEGNVLLTIVGVIIIGLIRNALNLIHVNILWNNVVTGAVIIAAVLLDSFRKYLQRRMSERALMRME